MQILSTLFKVTCYSLHQCQFCSCYDLQEHIKIEQIQVFIHTHEGKISTSQIYIETKKNYLLTLNQISISNFHLGWVTRLLSNRSSLGWISLRQPKVIIVLVLFSTWVQGNQVPRNTSVLLILSWPWAEIGAELEGLNHLNGY